jgi:hypothetical protein
MVSELIELESQGWQALSTSAEESRRFYDMVLRDDAIMLFPGGMRLEGKAEILASLEATPWGDFQIEDPVVLSLSSGAAVLSYKVTARRKGSAPYVALISSTYAMADSGWRLVLHQQTAA